MVSTERLAESTLYQRAEALQRIAAGESQVIAPGLTMSILRPSVGLWPHPGKPDGASEFFLITGAGIQLSNDNSGSLMLRNAELSRCHCPRRSFVWSRQKSQQFFRCPFI